MGMTLFDSTCHVMGSRKMDFMVYVLIIITTNDMQKRRLWTRDSCDDMHQNDRIQNDSNCIMQSFSALHSSSSVFIYSCYGRDGHMVITNDCVERVSAVKLIEYSWEMHSRLINWFIQLYQCSTRTACHCIASQSLTHPNYFRKMFGRFFKRLNCVCNTTSTVHCVHAFGNNSTSIPSSTSAPIPLDYYNIV